MTQDYPLSPKQMEWVAIYFATFRKDVIKCIGEIISPFCTPEQLDRLQKSFVAMTQCRWLDWVAINEVESVLDELFEIPRIWDSSRIGSAQYPWEFLVSDEPIKTFLLTAQELTAAEEELIVVKDEFLAFLSHLGASLIYIGNTTDGVVLVLVVDDFVNGRASIDQVGRALRQAMNTEGIVL